MNKLKFQISVGLRLDVPDELDFALDGNEICKMFNYYYQKEFNSLILKTLKRSIKEKMIVPDGKYWGKFARDY